MIDIGCLMMGAYRKAVRMAMMQVLGDPIRNRGQAQQTLDRRRLIVSVIFATCFDIRQAQAEGSATGVPRIAFVFSSVPLADMTGPEPADPNFRAFLQGMRALGWIDGRNIGIERHSAEGRPERALGIMQALVRNKVDVIVTLGGALRFAREATDSIPIVTVMSDPLGSGMVENLGRPGSNITGVSTEAGHMDSKRLQFLKDLLPRISRVAVITKSERHEARAWRAEVESAAHALGLLIAWIEVNSPEAMESALDAVVRKQADAIYAIDTQPNYLQRRLIAQFAVKHRLPSIFAHRDWVEAGGLMSYAANFDDLFRRAAAYVDKILKGAKPATLPFEQPAKFELLLNGTTAKALGLTIPAAIGVLVDEVIK